MYLRIVIRKRVEVKRKIGRCVAELPHTSPKEGLCRYNAKVNYPALAELGRGTLKSIVSAEMFSLDHPPELGRGTLKSIVSAEMFSLGHPPIILSWLLRLIVVCDYYFVFMLISPVERDTPSWVIGTVVGSVLSLPLWLALVAILSRGKLRTRTMMVNAIFILFGIMLLVYLGLITGVP